MTADDVVAGIVCMQCLAFLIADDGTLCDAGHPVACEECWRAMPKGDRPPYFNEESGEVLTE